MRFPLVLALLSSTAFAQFTLQQSNSTASFRGIHAVSDKIAWASGTGGTVLHTIDGGEHWLKCSIPEGAEKLDFRGIQAFDEKTAIVMSSGKGDASRIYKTTDACKNWKLVFTNPDREGFWDTLAFESLERGWLFGDPVDGRFTLLATFDGGLHWTRVEQSGLMTPDFGGSAFAASNSLLLTSFPILLATSNGWLYQGNSTCTMGTAHDSPKACLQLLEFEKKQIPIANGGSSSGIFSIARQNFVSVAVGGDYQHPDTQTNTAAYSEDNSASWKKSQTPPHGYRSSVAYSETLKAFIAVGTNGTDVSYDNGNNWKALGTNPDQSDNWNALSLPFVVGPKGRIGKLDPAAFKR